MTARLAFTAIALAASLLGCASRTDTAHRDAAAPPVAAAPHDPTALVASRYPLSPAQLATTNEAIYLGNLDARIDATERALAERDTPALRAALAGALEHRHRITGRLADAERALAEIARATRAANAPADAHLVHAGLLLSFHRFGEARAALDRARAAGADAALADRLGRDLALALGEYATLREDLERSAELVPDFYGLAHRADLRVLLGDPGGASRLYRAAQDFYTDVDPLPLAWLYTQQGIALLRHGDAANARRFFEAAHARLPSYVLAAEHLAETLALTGEHEAARALYLRVVGQTGNPEFIAALGDVESALGHAEASRERYAEAARVYNAWLAKHPAAYAQHAAEFHLERGNAARAYALAKQNLALRRDVGSLILHAKAAEAAGDRAAACASRRDAIATGLKPPEVAELDALAEACR